jgi:tRNA nucleotidyltransferase (CCA-adding enzyme)
MVDLNSRRMISQREGSNELLNNLYKFEGDNYQLYTLLAPYDTETLLYVMAKASKDKTKRFISTYFTRLKGAKILLKGKDLVKMGLLPGPLYKEVFDRLLEARLNKRVKSREDEVRFVEKNFGAGRRGKKH